MKRPHLLLFLLSTFSVLEAAHEITQPRPHSEAEKAMAGIDLERDFGPQLKFHSREIVTMAINNQILGMNGLMSMRWRGDDPHTEITASVQWFEHRSDLLNFYAEGVNRDGFQLGQINGAVVWEIGEHGFSWTDGEHFLVSLIGSPPPPPKMLNAWMASVPSNVAEIENAKRPNSGK
tara:strand:- start:649 stop:1179 length:531 start_codon:yes stop_codon:yes gene_type:complete